MEIYKPARGSFPMPALLVILILSMLSAQSIAGNYSLEIIQPRANLDIENRFYRAYPGLEYNVRLSVIGGEYPYRFELALAPEGMSIDDRGEIIWPNPVQSATPYDVTATVTDAEETTRDISWTITVTTSGFRFIDALNGNTVEEGGAGTIDNPWKEIKDWYEGDDSGADRRDSFAGEFLYYRDGTYLINGYIDSGNNDRFLLRDGNKPNVWLAYPGESPVIDFNSAYINIWQSTNTYIDGFEFAVNGNTRGMGWVLPSGGSNVTFRRNKSHGITNGFTGGNNALMFLTAGGVGKYWSIQDNEFYGVNTGYGVLGYSAERVLIEDNIFHHIGSHPVGPKEGTAMWFIRNNRFYANTSDAIGLQYSDSRGILSGDIEISFNFVEADGGMVRINSNQTANGNPVYVFRNTFLGSLAQVARPTSTNGPFYFYRNVIVNETSHPEKIQRLNVEDASRIVVSDNLTGRASDNIVDSQGYLTPAFSAYVGIRGHQIGDPPVRPSPPAFLNE